MTVLLVVTPHTYTISGLYTEATWPAAPGRGAVRKKMISWKVPKTHLLCMHNRKCVSA